MKAVFQRIEHAGLARQNGGVLRFKHLTDMEQMPSRRPDLRRPHALAAVRRNGLDRPAQGASADALHGVDVRPESDDVAEWCDRWHDGRI
ncbi:hypothetical protein [Chitinasiproducens palmae]|uniref:hypothetical protein n=1 Tax=Chitinasiproducens palmae TaxID=1770053 RepID=UPI001113B76D|nr:hypothetical protein [Chitinasiproducens palmae]